MDRPRAPRLAPRLVIVFAVLACVFGWGHSASVAASSEAAPAHPVIDNPQASSAGHDRGHGATPAVSPDAVESAGDAAGAHHRDHSDGHNAAHDHAVFCMASSATSALGLVPAPDVAALLVTVVPAQPRHRAGVVVVNEPRAPSIAALCVLRT